MKLSLCIATYNEDRNIHYPLDSAYDLVDEVIIVDGGSTDKTVEIAKSYDISAKGRKIKVFMEDNPPMFHINKQKAIERAKGEWILQLDADEALSDGLREEIKAIIEREAESEKRFVAYWIPRKNYFLTRFLTKGGQYPDYTIRLYRNGVARFPCKTVHENVEVKGEIGYLKNPILHYADPDFSRFLKRWDRYTSSEADLLAQEKKQIGFIDYFFIKPVVWFFLAYFRHRGYVDGLPGFVFALFSSIRFWAIYVKWWQNYFNADRLQSS